MTCPVSRVLSRMIIYLGRTSPHGSSDLPGRRRAALSSLLGLASDGVYTACPVAGSAVVSYTAISPLPGRPGGIFSVALSLGSPPPDVIRHPALRSPDFPHTYPFVCMRAIICAGHSGIYCSTVPDSGQGEDSEGGGKARSRPNFPRRFRIVGWRSGSNV